VNSQQKRVNAMALWATNGLVTVNGQELSKRRSTIPYRAKDGLDGPPGVPNAGSPDD